MMKVIHITYSDTFIHRYGEDLHWIDGLAGSAVELNRSEANRGFDMCMTRSGFINSMHNWWKIYEVL